MYEKNHLLLRILAVIGIYGPHLMIVMIFVTQNNFQNGPGISDRLLGFYQCMLTFSRYKLVTAYDITIAMRSSTNPAFSFLSFLFCFSVMFLNEADHHDIIKNKRHHHYPLYQ